MVAYYTDCFDLAGYLHSFHTLPQTTQERRQGVVDYKPADSHQLDQDHTLEPVVFEFRCCSVQPAIIVGRDEPAQTFPGVLFAESRRE